MHIFSRNKTTSFPMPGRQFWQQPQLPGNKAAAEGFNFASVVVYLDIGTSSETLSSLLLHVQGNINNKICCCKPFARTQGWKPKVGRAGQCLASSGKLSMAFRNSETTTASNLEAFFIQFTKFPNFFNGIISKFHKKKEMRLTRHVY